MGSIGCGYGSEWHLLRFMGRHRHLFDKMIISSIGKGSFISWLDFRFSDQDSYDRELKGLEFLSQFKNLQQKWAAFWPQSGNVQNWDGIGWLYNLDEHDNSPELILLEAKAHLDELKSDCKAEVGGKGYRTIVNAMRQVQNALGIFNSGDWLKNYYQYANRIAALWFLNENGIPARFASVYFIGDDHKGKDCPQNKSEWDIALRKQDQYLGIDREHPLKDRIHKVFLSVR